MAEFEELRINVKTSPEKAGENTRELQNFFRHAGGIEHVQNFEKLGRQFRLNDAQIKQLAEALGKQQPVLGAFATGFGKAGFALLAFEAALKVARVVTDEFNRVSSRAIETQHLAMRMGGVHAAQVEEDLKAMERAQIERGHGAAMLEKFNEKYLDFRDKSTGFKDAILKDVTGPFVGVVEQHFQELREAPDLETRMNLVKRFAEEINKYYVGIGRPEKGAQERAKYLETWFGSQAIAQMTSDFTKVSEETKQAWDKQQAVINEYWEVTTKISQNLNEIIKGIITTTLGDLGINSALIKFGEQLEKGAREHIILGSLSPEDRAKFEAELAAAGDKYWREHGIIEFLKKVWNASPDDLAREFGVTMPSPSGAHHLLENYSDTSSDLLAETKRLTTNLALMNSYLAIQAAATGGTAQLPYHNAPMGGAAGESNPIQLPFYASQPGGGATTEARRMNIGRAADPVTQLGLQRSSISTYDQLRSSGQATSGQLGAMEGTFGFTSISSAAAPRIFYKSEDNLNSMITIAHEGGHAGRSIVESTATTEPNIFKRYGLGTRPSGFGLADDIEEFSQRQQDFQTANKLYAAGVISRAEWNERFRRNNLFLEGKVTERQRRELDRHNLMTQERAHTILDTQRFNPRTGEARLQFSGSDLAAPETSNVSEAGRALFDKRLADDLNISGNLNVKVNAPSGTSVRANGEGLLKNVTLDRSMDSDFAGAP